VNNIVGALAGVIARLITTNALAGLLAILTGGGGVVAGAGKGIGTTLAGAIPGFAKGGAGVVTKPTLMMAGEGGAEAFQFTPLTRSMPQMATPALGGQGNLSLTVTNKTGLPFDVAVGEAGSRYQRRQLRLAVVEQ
jgi:hypothetical protein